MFIALLTKQTETYAQELQRQNWRNFGDQLQGTLHTKRTWHLLHSLLDPTNTRRHSDHKIQRLSKKSDLPSQCLLESIQHHFFGHPRSYPPLPVSHYTGSPNEDLDAPFTLTELTAVFARLTRNTTPGKDNITYRVLRNLDEETLQELLTLFNAHWQAGTLPAD
ncbi:hypothetical protein HPB48_022999 [Haemaphysalis longicornis]|uniref:Uncharacterized protein n=1 Tax=Haemaphysalis longicornis TaxID=44386 RepID=A0A9J6FUJ5_HAELO|nr:hypothetical protein HPB48_022999 [Haemaphysalis longicornis]